MCFLLRPASCSRLPIPGIHLGFFLFHCSLVCSNIKFTKPSNYIKIKCHVFVLFHENNGI